MEIHAYDSNLEGHRHLQLMRSLGWEDVREISGNGMCYTGIRDSYTTFLKEQGRFDDVLDFFKQEEQGHPEKVIHPLLHFDVKKMDERPELRPGTGYIAFRISQKLDKRPQDERMKLMNWLDGHGKPATFLAWLFENYAHERLLEGLTLNLRDLSTGALSEVTVSETKGHYKRFSVAIPLSQALLEAYRTLEAQNLRSIDGYKVQNGILWLFQMTRNMDHQVHTEGILDLLKHLRLLEDRTDTAG